MDRDQREVLLEDYKLSYNIAMSFSSMRVTAFSVAAAIIGVEASFGAQMQGFFAKAVASILLMFTAAISTNILVALNRGTFLYIVHCRGVENRLSIAGFPTTYLDYVNKHNSNTGIFAFWLAALLLDIAAFSCVPVLIWSPSDQAKTVYQLWFAAATSLVAFGLLAWALYSLLWHLPKNYLKELERDFVKAQDDAMGRFGL
jgi:hypothetical protein